MTYYICLAASLFLIALGWMLCKMSDFSERRRGYK